MNNRRTYNPLDIILIQYIELKKNLTRKLELNELKHELTNFDNHKKIIYYTDSGIPFDTP